MKAPWLSNRAPHSCRPSSGHFTVSTHVRSIDGASLVWNTSPLHFRDAIDWATPKSRIDARKGLTPYFANRCIIQKEKPRASSVHPALSIDEPNLGQSRSHKQLDGKHLHRHSGSPQGTSGTAAQIGHRRPLETAPGTPTRCSFATLRRCTRCNIALRDAADLRPAIPCGDRRDSHTQRAPNHLFFN